MKRDWSNRNLHHCDCLRQFANNLNPGGIHRHPKERQMKVKVSRRSALGTFGTGLGLLALPHLIEAGESPLAVKQPHFAAKAKHIIHVYLNGGPSQVDTWDYKPALAKYDGKKLPVHLPTEREVGVALPTPFKFKRYGEGGLWCSEIFERTASQHADKICVIKSMYANTPNHEQSMRLMNSGDERLSRPSYGAWLTYGLGTENQNLPGYVAMCPGLPVADSSNWRSSFLPGIYQGTYLDTRNDTVEKLIANINTSYQTSCPTASARISREAQCTTSRIT